MDIAPHRQQIARALETLEAGIADLIAALAHSKAAVRLESAISSAGMREACEAYSAIDYRMEDDVGTSVVCIGAIGVSGDILKRAQAVNELKRSLKALCAPLNRVKIRIPVKGEPSPTRLVPAMRVILRNIQRSDLNLLAAYRKIPLLELPPASITYTRANTRAVYRKSIEEITALLDTAAGPTAIADRERLMSLSRRETHLALVKERYQNVRANVLYAPRLDSRGRGRLQIAAELPILYPTGRREAPQIVFPAPAEARPPRRRESLIEPKRFLQSIPVHRYSLGLATPRGT